MPLPVLDKTWTYDVNISLASLGSSLADNRRLLRLIKNKLILLSGGKWAVKGSSNGFSAAMDGVDRWLTDGNLRWNWYDSARSWIVLKRTDAPFEVMIDLAYNWSDPAPIYAFVAVSSSGFTGGSTVAHPDADDDYPPMITDGGSGYGTRGGVWHNLGNIAYSSVLHCWGSSDGDTTRFVMMRNGTVFNYMSFEAVKAPVTGMNPTHLLTWTRADASYARLNDINDCCFSARNGRKFSYAVYHATEGYKDGMLGEKLTVAPNELSMEWPICPISFVSDTHGCRGRLGRPYDLYFATTAQVNGDAYPADGGALWIVFGDLIFPWNGGPVVMT